MKYHLTRRSRLLVPVCYIPRIHGGIAYCFWVSEYQVWKVISGYRKKPHHFRFPT